MAKVEHPTKPMRACIRFHWATLDITIEPKSQKSFVEAMMIAGHMIDYCKVVLEWGGIPRFELMKIFDCPECKRDSSLKLLEETKLKCPYCGYNFKDEIEI